ncbi:hypothetical protein ACFQZ4_19630 [Catellatospora coxensis]|uniref:Uncharacterized protein n=1 Tax=Catellatospora coxensis TaxID=310354 RepID=A0A8J3KK17_9ACTN|nr:hypothetical protein [Catellatospora coxensis]GIG04437.1 hypothetical protein Cco03nite_11370 [Catellatospora coxensis]
MIKRMYEAITGTPWTTGRSCTADFGPTIAARYVTEVLSLTEQELHALHPAIAVAYLEHVREIHAMHGMEHPSALTRH